MVTVKPLDKVLDWLSGLVTVTLREPTVAVAADADAGSELSGRVEGAGVHGYPCPKRASGAALEVTAGQDRRWSDSGPDAPELGLTEISVGGGGDDEIRS